MISKQADYSKRFTFYLFSIVTSVSCSETFFNAFEDRTEDYALDKCISKILRKDFACDAFITLAYSQSDVDKLIEAVNKDKCYTVNVRSFDGRDWNIWNEIYIVVTENLSELIEGLDQLQNEMFWNPRAQFLVSTHNVNDDEMQTLFNHFLTNKMYEAVFLNHIMNETYVHTYRPFHEGNCGTYIEGIENLGKCLEIDSAAYFPKNITSGLKNCQFKVVKYSYSNKTFNDDSKLPILEQFIVDTFANNYNYSISYNIIQSEINYGVVLPNRTVTGLLGKLQRNIADIAVGSTVVIKNRADVFDYICGFKIASFKLFTSSLGKEMWKKVYTEFDSNTWLLILSFYVLMILVCILLLNMPPKIPFSHTYLIMKLWGFFYLGNGTEPYEKTQRLRTVTAFWIWFTFFISSFYNSDMYSLITGHVQHKRQIEPEELDSISYRPCISKVIETFFIFAYNETLPKSVDIADCRTIDGAFKTVANGFDLYTVQLKESYLEREKYFIDSEGNRMLEAWDFTSDIILGFYINKGFPVKNQLQMHAQRLYENGLVEYYLNLLNPLRGSVDHRKKNKAQPFVLGDFRVHFGVLFLGSILSTFTFVIEILYNRKR